ncbi:uncharacterized protein [Procambarus clarkii]|uniref:uncharacterized protein isoform X2 n=1 Tax=Procambarus clarkii TaxID=6728 RepID=UPI0037428BBE
MAMKKSNMIPQEMRHKYLEDIYKEAGDELDQIYTDGSSNPINGRAGAAYTVIKDNTFQRRNEEKARIENYASSTQAELTAIVMALRFLERNTNGAVICTDSKAALQSLSKNQAENLAIVAEIKRAVRVLTNQGRVIKFLWIPSHVGICGNERADVLAAEGAEGDHIEYFIPKTQLQIRGIIRQHRRDKVTEERRIEAQTSESVRWYNMVAAGNPNQYGRRGGRRVRESVIARIRLGYKYPWRFGMETTADQRSCRICGESDGHRLDHYLRECEHLRDIRNNCRIINPTLFELGKHYLSNIDTVLKRFPHFAPAR